MPDGPVFLGIDVAKDEHEAVGLDAGGNVIYWLRFANSQAAIEPVVEWATSHQARVIVDQPAGMAALLLQLCWEAELETGYLNGLAMAQARSFYPGRSKTDTRDAWVLADIARTHPERLSWLQPAPDERAELALLVGPDTDLRHDINRAANRLRDLLSTHWPAVERAIGDKLTQPGVLLLLHAHPSGPALGQLGETGLVSFMRQHQMRNRNGFVQRLLAAAREQTVAIRGSAAAARLISQQAGRLHDLIAAKSTNEEAIQQLFFALPQAAILTSLPGVGPLLGAQLTVMIGDVRRFPSASHLASFAGLGPTPHRTGANTTGIRRNLHGHRQLKFALVWSCYSALRYHPPSRAYYDRKRSEGKRHRQALLALARRRVTVLYQMLKDQRPYRDPLLILDERRDAA